MALSFHELEGVQGVLEAWGDAEGAVLFARAATRGLSYGPLTGEEPPIGSRRLLWASRLYKSGRTIEIREPHRTSVEVALVVEEIERSLMSPVQSSHSRMLAIPKAEPIELHTPEESFLIVVRGIVRHNGRLVERAGCARLAKSEGFTAETEGAVVLCVSVTIEPGYRMLSRALASELASSPEGRAPLRDLFNDSPEGDDARARLADLVEELRRAATKLEMAALLTRGAATRREPRRPPKRTTSDGDRRSSSFYVDSEWGLGLARRPDDIHIVTHQRSGTTWTQMILFQLLSEHGDMDRVEHMYEVCPYPSFELRMVGSTERLDALPSPRVFKSHAKLEEVWSDEGRFIVVARDGRDVVVSAYHHQMDVGDGPVPFDVFVDQFIERADWFEDVAAWWARRNEPNVLFLTYRDLESDLRGAARRIAELCSIEVTEATLDRVVERASFSFMKRYEHKLDHFEGLRWLRGLGKRQGFLRRGGSGEGARRLSEAQLERFERALKQRIGDPELVARLSSGSGRLGSRSGEPVEHRE